MENLNIKGNIITYTHNGRDYEGKIVKHLWGKFFYVKVYGTFSNRDILIHAGIIPPEGNGFSSSSEKTIKDYSIKILGYHYSGSFPKCETYEDCVKLLKSFSQKQGYKFKNKK